MTRKAANDAELVPGSNGRCRDSKLRAQWIFGTAGEDYLAVLDIPVTPGRTDLPRTVHLVSSSLEPDKS